MTHKEKLEAAIDLLESVDPRDVNDNPDKSEAIEMIQDVADCLNPTSISEADNLLPALGTIDMTDDRAVRKIQTAIMYMKNIGEDNTDFLVNVIEGRILSADEMFQVLGIIAAMQIAGLHETYKSFGNTDMTPEQSMHAMVEGIINYHPMTIKQLSENKEN